MGPGQKPQRPVFSQRGSIITKIFSIYHKVPKFSDARKPCYNQSKIQTKRPNLRVFHQKDAKEKLTKKTQIRLLLEEQSDLGLHCLPRPICPKI